MAWVLVAPAFAPKAVEAWEAVPRPELVPALVLEGGLALQAVGVTPLPGAAWVPD
ncbi:MAG: hypothetical protein OHK005_12690 [Candidatus Methylacidiphilales bacterium]